MTDSNLTIPLLMRNKVPDGFETDERLDVRLRPDEVCFTVLPVTWSVRVYFKTQSTIFFCK